MRRRHAMTLSIVALLACLAAGPATTTSRPALALQAIITSTLGGDAGGVLTLSASGDRVRIEHEDGRVTVERYDLQRSIDTDPARRVATVREYFVDPPTLLDLVRNPPAGEPIGERRIDDRPARGVERPGDGRLRDGTVRIWTDVATSRPARIEVFAPKKPDEPAIVIDRFAFDVPLDGALFSLAPPDGFAVEEGVGVRPERLRPAATTQEVQTLVLTPGIGLGPATFGMSYEQIVAAIGPPDQRRSGQLNYFSRGFTLLVGGDDHLHGIAASAAAATPYSAARDFPGRTDKNVRIGTTRADVVAAYGEPIEKVERPRETLVYEDGRLRFEFDNARVVRISLSAPER